MKANKFLLFLLLESAIIVLFVSKFFVPDIHATKGETEDIYINKINLVKSREYLQINMPMWYKKLKEDILDLEARYHKLLPVLMTKQIELDNLTENIFQKQGDLNRMKLSVSSALSELSSLKLKSKLLNSNLQMQTSFTELSDLPYSQFNCANNIDYVCVESSDQKNNIYLYFLKYLNGSNEKCCVSVRINSPEPNICNFNICVNIMNKVAFKPKGNIINYAFTYVDSFRPMLDEIILHTSSKYPQVYPLRKEYLACFLKTSYSSKIYEEITTDLLKLNNGMDFVADENLMKKSTFCIIPLLRLSSDELIFDKVVDCINVGSIPVIINVDFVNFSHISSYLPFSSALTKYWQKSMLIVPISNMKNLLLILNNIEDRHLFEMKRHGHHLISKYLMYDKKFLNTLLFSINKKFFIRLPNASTFDSISAFSKIQLNTDNTYGVNSRNVDDGILGPTDPQIDSDQRSIFSTLYIDAFNVDFYDDTHFHKYLPIKSSVSQDPLQYGLNNYRAVKKIGQPLSVQFSESLGGNDPYEQFTIVILTHNRYSVLNQTLQILHNLPYLHSILIVWNSEQIPDKMFWPKLHAPIHFLRGLKKNSLNNRFLPFDIIKTEAVFTLDDDVQLHHEEILLGFRVWRNNRDRIVGYPARGHYWDATTKSWKYIPDYSCEMSLILTGAAFIHYQYLYEYSYTMDEKIREFVDKYMNCEDIAMNFLVSHITRKSPLKVTNHWQFSCPGCVSNLWKRHNHMDVRSECINYFSFIFGYNPLLHTQYRADSLLYKSRLPVNELPCFRYV